MKNVEMITRMNTSGGTVFHLGFLGMLLLLIVLIAVLLMIPATAPLAQEFLKGLAEVKGALS